MKICEKHQTFEAIE